MQEVEIASNIPIILSPNLRLSKVQEGVRIKTRTLQPPTSMQELTINLQNPRLPGISHHAVRKPLHGQGNYDKVQTLLSYRVKTVVTLTGTPPLSLSLSLSLSLNFFSFSLSQLFHFSHGLRERGRKEIERLFILYTRGP